jgi:hypothetical protein
MSSVREGFVYVATGDGYFREAVQSAASLRRAVPTAEICLITDQPHQKSAPFSQVIFRRDTQRNLLDKLLAIEAPYDRVVFLDTDTFVVTGDITELFRLLDQFDLALLQENQRGWDYTLPGVPECFPEYNTGVIAFRRTPELRVFFSQWREAYLQLRATRNLKSDQPAFRQVLYTSKLRVATLPSEFHFLGNVPNYVMWKVRLIHARGDLQAIARLANEELGPRAYLPGVGVIRGYVGRNAWIRSLLRIGFRMLRIFFRRPADPAALNPSRWWQ